MSSIDIPCGALLSLHQDTPDLAYWGQEIRIPANCPSATTILAKLIFDGPIPSTQSMVISSAALNDQDVLDQDGNVKSCTEIQLNRPDVSCPVGTADGGAGVQFVVDIPALQTTAQSLTILSDHVNVGSVTLGAFNQKCGGAQSPQCSVRTAPGETTYQLWDLRTQQNVYSVTDVDGQYSDDCEMMATYGPLGGSSGFHSMVISGDRTKSDRAIRGGAYYAAMLSNTGKGQCGAISHFEPKTVRKFDSLPSVELVTSTMSLEVPCGDLIHFRPGSSWTETKFFGQQIQSDSACPSANTLVVKVTSNGSLIEGAGSLVISSDEVTIEDVLDDEGNVKSCEEIKVARPDVLCPQGTAEGPSAGQMAVQFTIDMSTTPYSATKFLTMLQDPDSISDIAAGSYDGEILDIFHQPASIVVARGQTVHYLMDMSADCGLQSLMCSIPKQFSDDCLMMGSWGSSFEEIKGSDFESEDAIQGCTQYTVSLFNEGPGQCGSDQSPIHCHFEPRNNIGVRTHSVDTFVVKSTGYSTTAYVSVLGVEGALLHIAGLLMMLCCIKALFRCCTKECGPEEEVVEKATVETTAEYRMMERL